MLTTQEAAKKLGVTRGRIVQLIHKGILPAVRFGWVWQIDEEDLEKVYSKYKFRSKS